MDRMVLLQQKLEVEIESDKDLIPKSPEFIQQLREMTNHFQELQSGMRKADIEEVGNTFQKHVGVLVDNTLALPESRVDEDGDLKQAGFEALLAALNVFCALPGTLSKIQELKAWLAKFQAKLSRNAFLQVSCEGSDVDFAQVSKLCSNLSKKDFANDPEIEKQLPGLLRKMLETLLTQAWPTFVLHTCDWLILAFLLSLLPLKFMFIL